MIYHSRVQASLKGQTYSRKEKKKIPNMHLGAEYRDSRPKVTEKSNESGHSQMEIRSHATEELPLYTTIF